MLKCSTGYQRQEWWLNWFLPFIDWTAWFGDAVSIYKGQMVKGLSWYGHSSQFLPSKYRADRALSIALISLRMPYLPCITYIVLSNKNCVMVTWFSWLGSQLLIWVVILSLTFGKVDIDRERFCLWWLSSLFRRFWQQRYCLALKATNWGWWFLDSQMFGHLKRGQNSVIWRHYHRPLRLIP